MNVFVIGPGRTASLTFAKACEAITNYSVAHESHIAMLARDKVRYSSNHIEVDNRLSWLLGRIDALYGDAAFYVVLKRNKDQIAQSYDGRWSIRNGVMRAYASGILMLPSAADSVDVCLDYVETVYANIELFLRHNKNHMYVELDNIRVDFQEFWQRIGATGNIDAALAEFEKTHNPSQKTSLFRKFRYRMSRGADSMEAAAMKLWHRKK